MPAVGKPIEIHTSFRFAVKIDGINQAAFTECTLPSLEVETQDLKEGGQNEYVHKLPVRVKAGSVKLRHGITRDGQLIQWYMQVLRGEISKAMRTVSIVMYDSTLEPVATWRFNQAYPIRWSGPNLKSGDLALAIEELELAHNGFDVE